MLSFPLPVLLFASHAAFALTRKALRYLPRRCRAPVTVDVDVDTPPSSSAPLLLSDALLRRYRRDGYLVVRNLMDEEDCGVVQAACEALVEKEAERLQQRGKLTSEQIQELTKLPFDRRLYQLFKTADCMEEVPLLWRHALHTPGFERVFCNDKILRAVSQLLSDAQEIRLFPNYTCRAKMPKLPAQVVAWHQDAGLRPDGGPNNAPVPQREYAFGMKSMVNAWMPLVDATRFNGAMKFVAGTHKLGCVKHVVVGEYRDSSVSAAEAARKAASAEAKGEAIPAGTFSTGIDPAVMQEYEDKFVWVECKRGDVVLFNNMLFHSAGDNLSNAVRWSFDWRYQDASRDTHRPQKGHTVFSRADPAQAASVRRKWACLALV